MAQSVSEWQALVVDDVDENDLLQRATQRDAIAQGLPKQIVKFPVDDLSQVAVLSWRWDGEKLAQGSRNVVAAIHQAKKSAFDTSSSMSFPSIKVCREKSCFNKWLRPQCCTKPYQSLLHTIRLGEVVCAVSWSDLGS
jgi:hypothetical protein